MKANQEALEADKKDGKSYNKTVMANVKFREALSWALNRKDFATTMTAGSGVGLAPINNSYVADVDSGVKYRDTEAGKAVISSVYGNSTTGYDPDKAVELLKPLLKGMAKERNCTVSVMATDINKFPFITVTIDKGKYEIPVACMNMRAMIKVVVDTVALKF